MEIHTENSQKLKNLIFEPKLFRTPNKSIIMNCSGMQITLPSPDGQNQIITGPYQIKMQLAHNSSPPIQGTEGLTKIEHYRTF